ncbi:MAG: hypothetical protein KZY74_13480 [Paenibacillaceae bacterium]|uniref:RCK N-terminal domain-containing protein n=1 Tax=Paenibacillus mellifer TaxID=2937794 RepID=A0A9X1Y5B8_9BACL|nr:hypothetical protein [Paenibacillus mellifer]MBW4840399.1 hypothetical protein [Paenibacillaceae bacterium]MCK8487567.1 hypothetical protein [Paenibacillus mellifer]
MGTNEYALVTFPNPLAVDFIRTLKYRDIPFALMVNNDRSRQEAIDRGIEHVILVDTTKRKNKAVPEISIGPVYIFEESLTLTCRYLQLCRTWTSKPVYVITQKRHPSAVYTKLGANYVIYTKGKDVSFILQKE